MNTVKLDKRNFDAYYGLGEASFKQRRFKKAIDHFKDARSIDKKNPFIHQYLMLSYLAVDDYKNVKKSYKKFSEIASEDEMNKFVSNKKYSAVLKIIEMP
ncbi:tetratricopeptide repeat protein [Candidatus Zixiibacteriota bacterium]